MTKIVITPAGAEALAASVAKWKECTEGTRVAQGARDCALCTLYWAPGCAECPIAADTGLRRCDGTPYKQYDEAYGAFCRDNEVEDEYNPHNTIVAEALMDYAKKEYEYLLSLQDRCVIAK